MVDRCHKSYKSMRCDFDLKGTFTYKFQIRYIPTAYLSLLETIKIMLSIINQDQN